MAGLRVRHKPTLNRCAARPREHALDTKTTNDFTVSASVASTRLRAGGAVPAGEHASSARIGGRFRSQTTESAREDAPDPHRRGNHDMHLSTHELTQFNRAVLAVYGAPSADMFAKHLLHALRLIVPGDIRVADFSGIAEMSAFTAYDPGSAIPAEVNAAVHRHLRDNPLYGRRNERATSISDLMTRRAWHRTALHGEAYAKAGQEDGLALDIALGGDGLLTLNVTRGKRGYSAGERLALGLLRPHVHAQWSRLRAEQRWRHALARNTPSPLDALSAREREVLAWVAGGKTNAAIADLLDIRPGTVKRHLENIYRKLGIAGRRDAAVLLPRMTSEADSLD